MIKDAGNGWIRLVLWGLALWLGIKYLLPVTVPFLLGGVIALAAEPGTGLLQKRWKWRRGAASGLSVAVTLLLMGAVVSLVGAAAVRELGQMAKLVPAAGETVTQGLSVLEDWLITLADKAPEKLRPMLIQTVLDTFRDGTALVSQATGKLPGMLANTLGWVSTGALTVGTGVLAGFMISVRLPRIKSYVKSRIPQSWHNKLLPALRRVRITAAGWLKAQLKLMAVTWGVVSLGFLVVGITNPVLWAALVALVDAVPILGTGTVLVPWAVVKFLQQNVLQGAGLLATYGAALLLRTVLEPRLVGRSLGIDPLLSLAAFYAGFRLWGVAGMILAPMAAALTKGLAQQFTNNS